LMLDLFILRNTKRLEYRHQFFRTEQTHQIVFQRDIETGFTRISLTSGTSAELIVNTAGLMTLCTDDLQTAGFFRHIVQLDIGTTSCHVGGNGYGASLTRMGNDLRLQLMEFRVQHLMLDSLFLQHPAEQFRGFDGYGTY